MKWLNFSNNKTQDRLAVLVIVAAVLLSYANVYENGFVLDDEFLLQKNRFIRDWSWFVDIFRFSSTGGAGGVDSFYRPLQILMYLIFNQLFGFSTVTFHALNVLLHAANSGLVYLLARRLGFKGWGGFLAAVLWAVHPVHTEAVTYMSATADPLHTFFILSALWLMAPDFNFRNILWSLPFFILALLSKESAIVLPAITCACLYLRGQNPFSLKTWPLWLIALLYLVLRLTLLNFNDSFDFYKSNNIYTENFLYRLYTFLATLPNYVELVFWPRNLHLERSFPVFTTIDLSVALGMGLIIFTMVMIYFERKKIFPAFTFAVLWALASHAPQSGLVIPVNSFFLEHWLYLTSIGFFIVSALVWNRVLPFASGLILVLAPYLGYLTFKQNRTWKDPITFYSYILSVETNPPARVFNNLGMAYSDANKIDEAIVNYENAIRISDHYPQTRHNLALALLTQNRVDEATTHLEAAIKMDPNFYHSYSVLAQIYNFKKDYQKAEEYRRKFTEIRSRFL